MDFLKSCCCCCFSSDRKNEIKTDVKSNIRGLFISSCCKSNVKILCAHCKKSFEEIKIEMDEKKNKDTINRINTLP